MRRNVPQAMSGTTNKITGENKMKKMKVEEVGMKSHLSKALILMLSAFLTIPVVTFAGQAAAGGGGSQNNKNSITFGEQPGKKSNYGGLPHLGSTEPHTLPGSTPL